MNEVPNIFQSQHELFRKYALVAMQRSPEYQGIDRELDQILILADRVLVAFREHLEFSQIGKIAEHFERLKSVNESSEVYSGVIEGLLQSTEQWLKTLLWLIYEDRWMRLNQSKRTFTLFPAVRELDLLTQTELDLPEQEVLKITDEVHLFLY